MTVFNSSQNRVLLTVALVVAVQIGLSLLPGVPVWLFPLLTVPTLCLLTRCWWDAEKQNQDSQAFARLVV